MLRAVDAWKTYRHPEGGEIPALRGANLEVRAGELVALTGPSGCGKSTLLHCLGGLDTPDRGEILYQGENLHRLDDRTRTVLRRREIGYVFQFFNLVPTLDVLDNVLLPCLLDGRSNESTRTRALELLQRVGLEGREHSGVHQLSGGQQQRVALARALVIQPKLILGDEPTGNLDSNTSDTVLALMLECAREQNAALVLATHSSELAARADRVVRMRDGKVDDAS